MKQKRKAARLALVFYGLFLLLWLAVQGFWMVGDGLRAEQVLELEAAELENLHEEEGGALRSENADPQLIFGGIGTGVRLVRLEASFERAPGEMALFYTRQAGNGFGVRQRVMAVPQDDGSWLYALPPGNVDGLRLDPGSMGDNGMVIERVVLNPRLPWTHYFVPGLRGVLAFAVVPALGLCLWYTVMEWMRPLLKRRAGKKAKAHG